MTAKINKFVDFTYLHNANELGVNQSWPERHHVISSTGYQLSEYTNEIILKLNELKYQRIFFLAMNVLKEKYNYTHMHTTGRLIIGSDIKGAHCTQKKR